MPAEPLPGFEDVTVERNVPCTTRDGVTLYGDVYRPAGRCRHPALLMREPYDKNTGQTGSGYAHPSWWAARGYVTVVQDCRGRFRSEGDWYPFVYEAHDGYDAVEWAARLPGADGRVAMYGFSYPGATQVLAASQRPPSLVAICPAFSSYQYHEGWTYKGGAFALAFAANWAAGLAFDTARRAGDAAGMAALAPAASTADWFSSLPLDELAPLTRENAPYFFDWLEHPAYDDYWRAIAIDDDGNCAGSTTGSRAATPACSWHR
jgi:putative CocE/NonD family hydrolase